MARKAESTCTGRQESDRQAFGLRIPRAADRGLRALRAAHQPAFQGWRLWSATWLLLSYLEGQSLAGDRVIDAGCGWGLAGVYCAQRGATAVCCDIDPEVLPFARYHARVNDVAVDTRALGFDGVDAAMLADAAWLVGAEICFRGDLIDPVFDLVERARATATRVVIADPGRPSFQSLASRCVDELDAWSGPVSVAEPLVDWSGERLQVHGRLLIAGGDPPAAPLYDNGVDAAGSPS